MSIGLFICERVKGYVVCRMSYDPNSAALDNRFQKYRLFYRCARVNFHFDGEEASVGIPSDEVRSAGVAHAVFDRRFAAAAQALVVAEDARAELGGFELNSAHEAGFSIHAAR